MSWNVQYEEQGRWVTYRTLPEEKMARRIAQMLMDLPGKPCSIRVAGAKTGIVSLVLTPKKANP